jgi:hypothetical protein
MVTQGRYGTVSSNYKWLAMHHGQKNMGVPSKEAITGAA